MTGGRVAARAEEEQGSICKEVQMRMEVQRDLHLGAKVDSLKSMVDFIVLGIGNGTLGSISQVSGILQDSPLTVLCGKLRVSVLRWKFCCL